jgi:hypothetical protein
MMQFKGFKPEAMKKIQGTLGFQGYAEDFDKYLEDNPDKKATMDSYNKKAIEMMNGGIVMGYANGGTLGSNLVTGQGEFDADGVFGDPRRTRQDLNFDPATGTYTPVGAMAGPLAKGSIPGMGLDNFGPGGVDPRTGTSDMRDRSFQPDPRGPVPVPQASSVSIGQEMINQAYNPSLPYGGAVSAVGTVAGADSIIDPRQNLTRVNPTTTMRDTAQGAVTPTAYDTSTSVITQGDGLAASPARQASDTVQGRTGAITADSTVTGVTDETTLVDGVTAAQGTAVKVDAPMQREIQAGEIISGSADAEKAAKFTEQVQAAEATPSKKATVAGQLESLMTSFDDGATPPWAAGAMRAAQERMLSRGMGASSMSGQAIVQAAMESALPIAQIDASTQATFEQANLSNRQQRAMQMAEQRAKFVGMEFDQDFQSRVQNSARIGDIANMNFTAEQQIALENSRAANTMELNNLSNRQGKVMAQAGALANLEQANLSNQQQAAVQNAQNFLAMDMQNMSNMQQADVFRAQQRQQALFSDAAAINASKQFNATSENQTQQFLKNLQLQTEQFNASQINAMDSQNQQEANAMSKFREEVNNQRDQFTAANQLIVDQNNATWRRQIATEDTAAVNRANELNAAATLDMSKSAFNNLWNYYGDTMEWAWTSAENQQERWNQLAKQQLINDGEIDIAKLKISSDSSVAFGGLIGKFLTAGMFGF